MRTARAHMAASVSMGSPWHREHVSCLYVANRAAEEKEGRGQLLPFADFSDRPQFPGG